MKAFVLAGGLGTRLKPRFGDLPKPLAPLGGRPFLARQLEWLAARGVSRAVILAGSGMCNGSTPRVTASFKNASRGAVISDQS